MNVLTKIFKAVANEKRLQMLKVLQEKGVMSIEEVAEALNLPYYTTARNLRQLESVGFLKNYTANAKVYYQINKDPSLRYNQTILELISKKVS